MTRGILMGNEVALPAKTGVVASKRLIILNNTNDRPPALLAGELQEPDVARNFDV